MPNDSNKIRKLEKLENSNNFTCANERILLSLCNFQKYFKLFFIFGKTLPHFT